MKVLWISDFNIDNNPGGSQRTDNIVQCEGTIRGHEITRFNFTDDGALLTAADYDVVVSNNLEHMRIRRPEVLQFIMEHPYHVRFEHDSCAYFIPQERQAFVSTIKRYFFLSEYHHQMFVKNYQMSFPNVEIITSPLDIDKFKIITPPEDREDKTLYIGFMHFLKGTHNFFEYVLNHPDEQFVVAAWGDIGLVNTVRRFPNVEFLGTVTYDKMHLLFNRFKKMYYHPVGFEAFCRSVGEAILCGVEVDVSDNIGAVHDLNTYGRDGLREMCQNSPAKFWDLVEVKP